MPEKPVSREDIVPGPGQVWKNKHTNVDVVLLGRRGASWFLSVRGATTTCPVTRLSVEYTYVRCNHDAYCCASHDVHTSPHRGCILH